MVEKRGPVEALDREAAALAQVAGRPWAPAVVAHGPGRLVTGAMPGAPRPLAGVGPAAARRLGAVLREAHETRRGAGGGLWWWDAPARSLEEYRLGRAADAGIEASRGARGDAEPDPEPFRLLHGDLVEANLVWDGDRPALVDWEFSRMGDAAEDLAYLLEVNGVPAGVAEGVLAGYGIAGVPGMAGRVRAWREIVLADAARWYEGRGMAAEAAALRARGGIRRG